jgi:Type IV secretory pathway, VirD4 components
MNSERITDPNHPVLEKLVKQGGNRKQLFSKYKDKSVLDVYFQELPEGHPAREKYMSILASAPAKTTIGNVVSTTLSKMDAFIRPGNAKLTSLETINYMDLGFGKQPLAIFIVVSDQDKSNHAIAANFIDQSFKELHKAGLREPTRKLPRKVYYIDEEFGNMVAVPEQAAKTTDGLKVGIHHLFVMQNYEQLDKNYGESDSATIISNCGNVILVKTKSKKTRETILDDLGDRSNLSASRQGEPLSSKVSFHDAVERIPMMTKSEMSRIPFGRSVVIRTMKTHDLKGNIIEDVYPIYNRDERSLMPTYEYIPYEEVTWDEINELYKNSSHTRIQTKDLNYLVDVAEISKKEARLHAIRSGEEFLEDMEMIDTLAEDSNDEIKEWTPLPEEPSFESSVTILAEPLQEDALGPSVENKELELLDDRFDESATLD